MSAELVISTSNNANNANNDNKLNYDHDEKIALEKARISKWKKEINEKSWNNHIEYIMKVWGEKAAGNREIHEQSAIYWSNTSNCIYIPLLFLSTLTGVSNLGAANLPHQEYWMYVLGSLNILCAFLTGLLKLFNPDEKAEKHHNIAQAFGSFYRNITLELGLSRADRTSCDELTNWARHEYDRMQKNAPSIPKHIIDHFKKTHNNDEYTLPDVALDTFVINIFNE